LFQAADKNAIRSQRGYLRGVRYELILLIIGALTGVYTVQIGQADWSSITAALAFGAALVVRVVRVLNQSDTIWYEGRAVAESAKSLAWRYAVGGDPFPVQDTPGSTTDALFSARLRETLQDVSGFVIASKDSNGTGVHVTKRMVEIRVQPLVARKASYIAGRVQDQIKWYSGRSALNTRRAQWWNSLMLIIELGGLAAAILRAVSVIRIDMLGVAATLSAAVMTWLQAKRYTSRAASYAVAERELRDIETQAQSIVEEQEWALFVGEAEEAISREHKLWRASRSAEIELLP
jgi:hypothetical protein